MVRVQGTIRRACRWLRCCGRRLQRNSVTLLVLLVLGLGEPLICIIHCDVWMPLMARAMLLASIPPAPHAHHAHQHVGTHHREASPAVVPIPSTLPAHVALLCTMRPGDSGPSPLVPLSLQHDLLLVAAALFGILLLLAAFRRYALLRPLFRAYPPPHPPPVVTLMA